MDSDSTDADSIHLGSEAVNFPDLELLISSEAIVASSATTRRQDSKETILLVEDEVFVRNATGEALESAGYRVLAAENATQALQVLGEYAEPVNLLLADIVMPGINGHELARDFSALCPQTRILLMSGYEGQLTSCERSVHRPEYLAKPFSIPMLLRRVREVLDRNRFDFEASA